MYPRDTISKRLLQFPFFLESAWTGKTNNWQCIFIGCWNQRTILLSHHNLKHSFWLNGQLSQSRIMAISILITSCTNSQKKWMLFPLLVVEKSIPAMYLNLNSLIPEVGLFGADVLWRDATFARIPEATKYRNIIDLLSGKFIGVLDKMLILATWVNKANLTLDGRKLSCSCNGFSGDG